MRYPADIETPTPWHAQTVRHATSKRGLRALVGGACALAMFAGCGGRSGMVESGEYGEAMGGGGSGGSGGSGGVRPGGGGSGGIGGKAAFGGGGMPSGGGPAFGGFGGQVSGGQPAFGGQPAGGFAGQGGFGGQVSGGQPAFGGQPAGGFAGQPAGGSAGVGGGTPMPIDCLACAVNQCPTAGQCFSNPTCLNGTACATRSCFNNQGFDFACVITCFQGDVSAATQAFSAFACIAQECTASCPAQ